VKNRERPGIVWFGAILLVIVSWQVFYCAVATRFQITGLFYIGAQIHWPEPHDGAFVYSGSTGYDGQIYRVIAHDPWWQRDNARSMQGARYWYRRILVPGSAAILGGRSGAAIDFWYVAITDILLALGGVSFVRLAAPVFSGAAAALLYCAIPAVVASTDRMVVDGPMLALTLMAWRFYREQRFGPLLAALVAAVLTRETAIAIPVGVALAFALKRDFRRAAWAALTPLPAIGWWAFLMSRMPRTEMDSLLSVPVLPQIARMFTRLDRLVHPTLNRAMQVLDFVACACLVFAFVYIVATAIRESRRHNLSASTALVLPIAIFAMHFSSRTLLSEPYHFMRHAGVLLAWVALRMAESRPDLAALYLASSGLSLLVYRVAPMLRAVGLML
jgi:hypothetical protein